MPLRQYEEMRERARTSPEQVSPPPAPFALESDDLKAKFLDLAAMAIWRSPADTLAYRDSEEARLAPIIRASGARVD